MFFSNLKPCFREEIQKCRLLFDYALENHSIKMDIVDIGGGFTGLEVEDELFRETATIINSSLDEFFPSSRFGHVKIIAEPGRFLCESALTICTKIIAKSTLQSEESVQCQAIPDNLDTSKTLMYYLNCGFYSGFMYIDPRNRPVRLHKKSHEDKDDRVYLSTLWGPTCDSLDVLLRHKYLPEYDVDEYLLFRDMGAYSNVVATSFNSFSVPILFYAAFEKFKLYKKAFDI